MPLRRCHRRNRQPLFADKTGGGGSGVKPSREIRSLTGIRGIAACYVVFYHWFQGAPSAQHLAYTFRGYLAVDLFFVLSGFVMTVTYRASLTSGRFDANAYVDFIYKRIARIYPAYFVILVVVWGLSIAGILPKVSGAGLGVNLFLVQAWGLPVDSIIGPAWSISTEFAAYFVFPFVAVWVLRCPPAHLVVTAVLASAFVFFVATRTDADLLHASRHGPLDVYTKGTPYPLIRCFAGFTLGIIACRLASAGWCQWILGRHYAADVVFLVVLLTLPFPGMDVAIVFLFVVLVISLSYERSLASKLLGGGYIYHSGVISYSLYLIHQPLNAVVRLPLERLLSSLHVVRVQGIGGLMLLPPLVLLAMACFHWVEKPARDAVRALRLRK